MSERNFTREDAVAATSVVLNLSTHEAARFALDVFYAARNYEDAAQSTVLRPAEIRHEIDRIYKLATSGKPTERRHLELFERLLKLSDAAKLHFGITTDEQSITTPGYPAAEIHSAIRKLCAGEHLGNVFSEVGRLANRALSTVPKDPGGSKTKDELLLRLILRLKHFYEMLKDPHDPKKLRRATHGWDYVADDVVGEFSQLVTAVTGFTNPPVSEHKVYKYLREALGKKPSS